MNRSAQSPSGLGKTIARGMPWAEWPACVLAALAVGFLAAKPSFALAADVAPSSSQPACQPASPGGPLFITPSCSDPELNRPYIDVKRPGTITDSRSGITVGYTYVHGGFTGSKVRFAFYFPTAAKYRGRFFQTTYPTIGQEDAAPGCPQIGTSACSVVFALSNGAYVVSSNNAGGMPAGGALAPYRANAAAAKYSRIVAQQLYGAASRPRGYIYGASGGGYQTVGSMENTSAVWDGAVPMVFGVPNAIPSFMTAQLLALRELKDKLPQIADAMAPGGSGDPYADLSPEQRSILKEVTQLGAPLRGWWQYATLNGGGFWAVEGGVRAIDRNYAADFWTKPGYEGGEPSVQAARIRYDTTVASLGGAKELILASVPSGDLLNADLEVTSGPKAGRAVQILKIDGNKVTVTADPGIAVGATVRLDNSWLIALQYYQRHQIPGRQMYGWDQYLDANGAPRYPQRSVLVGPILNASSAGSPASGIFHGKMIMVGSAMDVMAYPWSGDWYGQQAQAVQGASLADTYRVWYMDNADHGPDLSGYEAGVGFKGAAHASDHIVGYLGEVEQALLDLDAWVLKGAPPPASSGYRIDADNQVQLAATANQRHGVQPVVVLAARSGAHRSSNGRVDVAAGEPVTLSAEAETPPGAGKIVMVEWDFEGAGGFTVRHPLAHISGKVALDESYTFTKPGTYFPVVRVTSQRRGDPAQRFGLVQNLARVRVVVH